MRWLFLLIVLTPVHAVTVELGQTTFHASDDGWQGAPQDLGLWLDVRFTVQNGPPDWTSEATLTDGDLEVIGQAVNRNRYRFDIDGSPGGVNPPTLPLQGTEWTVHVAIFDDQAVVHRQAFEIPVQPIQGQGFWHDGPVETSPVPLASLGFYAGPTPSINAQNSSEYRILGPPNANLEWRLVRQTVTGWELLDQYAFPTDARGQATLALPDQEGLFGIGVTGPNGAAHWQLWGSNPMQLANLTPPPPGAAGLVQLTATGAATVLAPTIGYATNQAGPRIMGQGIFAPGAGTYEGTFDGSAIRQEQAAGYRIVAFFDQAGYVGHLNAATSLQPTLSLPILGVGEPATLQFSLRATHPGEATVTLLADGEPLGTKTVWLQREATGTFAWTPPADGSVTLKLIVDRGDLLTSVQETVPVLDAAAYEEAQQSWYHPDRLLPTPLLIPALAILAVALHKRQIRRECGPRCTRCESDT